MKFVNGERKGRRGEVQREDINGIKKMRRRGRKRRERKKRKWEEERKMKTKGDTDEREQKSGVEKNPECQREKE